MTDYNVTVGKELLPELLSGQDGLAKLIESVLNQVLEAQVSDSLGAERYERSEERQSYRNGYRARQLYTRVGPVTLQVPQTRDGSFSTEIFNRYQRANYIRSGIDGNGGQWRIHAKSHKYYRRTLRC